MKQSKLFFSVTKLHAILIRGFELKSVNQVTSNVNSTKQG